MAPWQPLCEITGLVPEVECSVRANSTRPSNGKNRVATCKVKVAILGGLPQQGTLRTAFVVQFHAAAG